MYHRRGIRATGSRSEKRGVHFPRSVLQYPLFAGGADMFYTMEEAADIGGFLELYLERDSVDPAVRERHRKFRQGLLGGALERADYEWAAEVLGFLRPQWWQEHEDHRALENALLKTRTLASKKIKITICGNGRGICRCRFSFEEGGNPYPHRKNESPCGAPHGTACGAGDRPHSFCHAGTGRRYHSGSLPV